MEELVLKRLHVTITGELFSELQDKKMLLGIDNTVARLLREEIEQIDRNGNNDDKPSDT